MKENLDFNKQANGALNAKAMPNEPCFLKPQSKEDREGLTRITRNSL
jgi:hypothetical protein